MCNIDRIKYGCSIIRIYVADEFGFHLECIVLLSPVLQCKIHCTRAKITTTDTDLNNGCKLFAGCVCNLAGMHLVCEIRDTVLLLYIESTLVNAICLHSVTELSSCELMKNESVLSGIDHSSVVKLLELIRKLCLVS